MKGYATTQYADGTTGYRAVDSADDLQDGETFSEHPPTATLASVASVLLRDVQTWLDSTAQENGYDSLASCISYLSSSISQYAADASSALAWRDAVWVDCFQKQQDALANPPSVVPTSGEFISQLPQPETFGWVVHQPGASG